jgi:V8-like Glu-specific endopeptidase
MPGIRPTRQEVSDRFPVLGFTVNTGRNPLFEVVLMTDPTLGRSENKSKRSPANFYSTRAAGPLRSERGEGVHLVSPTVLSRFAGQKLYYGLATFADASRDQTEIVAAPNPDSPWINLRGLTGRGSRRMSVGRVTPRGRAGNGNGYGTEAPASLEWAGDIAQPGTETITPAPAAGPAPSTGNPPTEPAPAPATQAGALDYDDGFGPLALEVGEETEAAETEGIEGPLEEGESFSQMQAYARPFTTSPEYPAASSFVQARHRRTPSTPRTIQRIVIHITDGQGEARRTAEYFQDPMRWLPIDVENGEAQMEMEDGVCKRFRYRNNWKDCVNGRTKQKGSRTLGLARAAVSAHYAVGQAGEVIQMVKHADVAFHASSANGDSIGIEHNARTPGTFNAQDTGLFPTDDQYRASARLVCWLAREFNIPKDRDHILGHAEAHPATSHTACPTGAWDWDRYWGFVTDGSCDPAPATAQGLGARARRARALSSDISYEVHLIPQPNKLACWAASMAMLVSFRRQVSLDPETLAAQVGRSLRTSYGWDMLEAVKNQFGFQDIQLPDNASLYYPPEQWHKWLNDHGPLWVTTIGAPSHAIIVHGISGDLTPGGTTIHILNPWDINTSFDSDQVDFNPFNNGAAYSRAFNDFASEFGNLDLDNYGRWRVLYLPPGATAQASARAQSAGQSFDLHWTDVPLIAQLQEMSCWEAAADMVSSWAGRSYSPAGPDPQTIEEIAQLFSLETQPAQSYTIEAFRNLLETKGPLWLAAKVPGFHAVVVTGLYSDGAPDGSDTFVRIQDPWDRNPGTPGHPGPYLDTHNVGSKYILSWRQLMEEYEAVPQDPQHAAVNVQILHNSGTNGKRPGTGQAQSFAARRPAKTLGNGRATPRPAPAARRSIGTAAATAPERRRIRPPVRSLEDPGEIVPDYSQVHNTWQALQMFWDWLQRSVKFRVGVTDTSFFPHSAIAKLRLVDGAGQLLGEGSGFYVGPHTIVTAGHCLVNDDGSRVQGVEVIPGLNGTNEPFGGASVGLTALKPHPKYDPTHYNASYDIGVIKSAPDAPNGQYFEMEELRVSHPEGIITSGYAAVGVDPTVQHMDVDAIRELQNGTFTYAAHVRQGSSGGPVFYMLDDHTIRVVGLNVTTYDAQHNRGLRLTDAMIAWINSV